MDFSVDSTTLLTGLLVFFARVTDVSLGTIRTISIVHGNMRRAFFLGFVEISLWLVVITAVLHQVMGNPLLGFFYALGFSTGNVVGIMLERRLAGGPIILRILLQTPVDQIEKSLRSMGFEVLGFTGYSSKGEVFELYLQCQRRDLGKIVDLLNERAPDALYIVEQAGRVNKIIRPTGQPATGWRAIFKRK